jgi:hypothetical protein
MLETKVTFYQIKNKQKFAARTHETNKHLPSKA